MKTKYYPKCNYQDKCPNNYNKIVYWDIERKNKICKANGYCDYQDKNLKFQDNNKYL